LITVSRALNGTGYVSQELKERILGFAKSKNYVPHRASQVLVRNRTHRIALFSSTMPTYFWDEIRRGVAVAADQIRPFDYDVHYHTIAESDSRSYIEALKHEIDGGVGGLAFVNQRLYDMDAAFKIAESAGIPYVTFNVDAPSSSRSCYIGTDYQAGGRLAAEFVGKSLQFLNDPRILIVSSIEPENSFSVAPNINGERLTGFLEVMKRSFPNIFCDVEHITTKLKPGYVDTQIIDLLRLKQHEVSAVYMIPAFNTVFLESLLELGYRRTVTVLHDLDRSSMHHLETGLLSAVVYQNPILQGYYTVKSLEHILESNQQGEIEGTEIVSNLIFYENRNLSQNHFRLIR
jgi:LacI family transcriptional regulator